MNVPNSPVTVYVRTAAEFAVSTPGSTMVVGSAPGAVTNETGWPYPGTGAVLGTSWGGEKGRQLTRGPLGEKRHVVGEDELPVGAR